MSVKNRKTVLLLLFIAANACVFWFRSRTSELPVGMRSWVLLQDQSADERQRLVDLCFDLGDFEVRPYVGDVNHVTIPRASHWYEQMIVVVGGAAVQHFGEAIGAKLQGKSTLDASLAQFSVVAINRSEVTQSPLPDRVGVRLTEKMLCCDACLVKSGISAPGGYFDAVTRFDFDVTADKLVAVERAVVVNGEVFGVGASSIPYWMVPTRQLAIGESWSQVGVSVQTSSTTSMAPSVEGRVARIVVFEGRRAAEVLSTATCLWSLDGVESHTVNLVEERRCFFDLESGEPLWFQVTGTSNRGFDVLARGCNQLFSRHLIRTTDR
jgi:hypothetical protein